MLAMTGRPLVGIGADGDIERHLAEERNAELFRFLARPAVRKDVRSATAMRTDEVAHILHHPEQRDFDLVEHRDATTGVDQRQILRRRHDHRSRKRHRLSHRQLRVAGARRHVDDQHVEFAPHDLAQELVQRRDHHRSAPDHRRALVNQEPDRHHLDAKAFERNEPLAVRRQARFGMESQELGHGGSEQVGVQNANGKSKLRKPDRKIAGDSRLAHASLAGGHCDNLLNPGQRFARPTVPPWRRIAVMGVAGRSAGDGARGFGGQRHYGSRDARNCSDRRLRLCAHQLHRLGPRRIDSDRDEHLAIANGDAGDRAGIGQGCAPVRAWNCGQRRHDLIARNHLSPSRSAPRPSVRVRPKGAAQPLGAN